MSMKQDDVRDISKDRFNGWSGNDNAKSEFSSTF
jgi:hypothetical protein